MAMVIQQNPAMAGGIALGTTLIGAATWAYQNQAGIAKGANAAMSFTNCVLNNKLQTERNNCFSAVNYMKENFIHLKDMDISNKTECTKMLKVVADDVRGYELTQQVFDDANLRTKRIWDKLNPKLKMEMERRIAPLHLSLQNIPKSSADLANWVKEAADCNSDRSECMIARDTCLAELKEETRKADKAKDKVMQFQDESKIERDILIERKGECKNLEKIELQNDEYLKENSDFKVTIFKLETTNSNLHELNNKLNKENDFLKTEIDNLKRALNDMSEECKKSQKSIFDWS